MHKKNLEGCCQKKIKTQEEEKEKLNKEEKEISTNNTQKFVYGNQYNKNTFIVYLVPIIVGDLLSRSTFFISYKAMNLNDEEVTQKLVRDVLLFFDTFFRIIFCKIFNEKNPYSERHK